MNKTLLRLSVIFVTGIIALTVITGDVSAANPIKNILRNNSTGSSQGILKKLFGNRAVVGNAVLTSISNTTLTVTKDGKTITVNTDDKTKLRRRFWGKASLSEMQNGDTLNIIGKWGNEEKTVINATLIRDAAIQKRNGVFVGTVQTLNADGWIMDTAGRGSQTIIISSGTKLVNRKGETISQADVLLNHRVRVRGLWDKTKNTITEVTQVKDYSIPIVVKPTGKVSK